MLNEHLSKSQLLAKGYLEEVGFSCISAEDKQSLTMSSELVVNDYLCQIIVHISSDFPLSYPKFFIKNENWFLKYPHIERESSYGNGICIIQDKDKKLHNNINVLLNDQLRRLKKYLIDLLTDQLDPDEIFDEFESYWISTYPQVYVNPETIHNTGIYKGYTINSSYLILDSYDHIEQFIQSSNTTYQEITFLYLDLREFILDGIPQTYKEFYEVVTKSGQDHLLKQLAKNKKIHSLLVFSFLLPNGETFYTGINIIYQNSNSKKYGHYHIFQNKVMCNKPLNGVKIENIHKNRVYKRGGNYMSSELSKQEKRIAIVGCGSVGASLSYKLLKSGITNLLLIDPQSLSVSNIGRHLLGQEYVSQKKATATKNFLEKQFIDCNIEAIPEKVENHLDKLENVDLIITALGNDAPIVEEEILKRSIVKSLPDTLSIWLEANAYAGHAVLIKEIGDYDIENISKKLAVLETNYAHSLEEQDAGCNATYMPYTFIDADQHINNFAKMIIQRVLNKPLAPIMSSIGDISDLDPSSLSNKYSSNRVVQRSSLEDI